MRVSGVTPASGTPTSDPAVRSGWGPSLGKASAPPSRLPPMGVRVTGNGPLTLSATIVVDGEGEAAAIGAPLSQACTSTLTVPAASAGSRRATSRGPTLVAGQATCWLANVVDSRLTTKVILSGCGLTRLSSVTSTSRAVPFCVEQADSPRPAARTSTENAMSDLRERMATDLPRPSHSPDDPRKRRMTSRTRHRDTSRRRQRQPPRPRPRPRTSRVRRKAATQAAGTEW